MTRDEAKEAVLQALTDVAPEIDTSALVPNTDLREQLDIDSMDLLNFVIGIHEHARVDIPEADYPQLGSLDDIVDYVVAKAA